ncbi:DNA replication/repair protein RecF [Pacificispira sp.]|uniref:DNA replication/repair protein RecF n=1 Tax=Pacificispira sp. TaxID=2888761 RepID=UPI003B5295B3
MAMSETGPVRALAVRRLRLTAFRNYPSAALDLDPRPVVLTGQNGAGKTNLLEAVSLLTPGRGLRRAKTQELDRVSPDGGGAGSAWAVAGTVDTATGPVDLGTGRDPEGDRRVVRIDGEAGRSQAALGEHLSVVWLTPQMDRLFQESSGERRRFLDRLIYGFDPAHAGRVTAYDKALRQRARLLKDGTGDDTWLGALEAQMIERGIAIAAARRDMADRLARACTRQDGPFPGAAIAVDGDVETWLAELPALEAEDRFAAALRDNRRRDAEAGGAAVGPHRSDLAVTHLAKGLPASQCSTGEQKALLIAIVLAHARLQGAERGAGPILLLDEVAAHLDEARRDALFGTVLGLGLQAWITGTDAGVFGALGGRAQYFEVAAATIRPAG